MSLMFQAIRWQDRTRPHFIPNGKLVYRVRTRPVALAFPLASSSWHGNRATARAQRLPSISGSPPLHDLGLRPEIRIAPEAQLGGANNIAAQDRRHTFLGATDSHESFSPNAC